jgi:DNA repair photolyase
MKPKTFTTARNGKGTREWADRSCNICIGCEHGCLYCYAKAQRCRFDAPLRAPGNWQKQRLNPNIQRFGELRPVGVVMFPTSHDLTPQFLPEALATIKNLLQNNEVLVVTKPHLSVVKALCKELGAHRHRILFRFTIGSLDQDLCAFWEPGAPSPGERIAALEHAQAKGYSTSISIEPMLDSVDHTCELVARVTPFVTDTIWIGKMQRVPQKLNAHIPDFSAAREKIRQRQTNAEIQRLVFKLANHSKVRWKDSIQAVLAKPPALEN